ncbi:MAG TPA: DMT family transporter [Steroidobacteraceae bacterium]|jgi:drug/metabolite transporter (DMT)-like permease|nr:DMT family transporter [Steroidobacteraceae bacterium]
MNARAAIAAALCAALLFGASTPFAKLLAGRVPPIMLAGLLYLGSGLGLSVVRLIRDRGLKPPGLPARQWPWLLGAIACGGILAPILLIVGLARIDASSAALLLNLEAVFTALLAWVVFRENAGRRVLLGMVLIVAGGVTLTGLPGAARQGLAGAMAIVAACLCWGLDNNLTRKVSGADALFVAAIKGLVAGVTNLLLALRLGDRLPEAGVIGAAMAVGLMGYGISLALYVLALRGLGSARTAAYFSTAPFLGAAIAIALFESGVPMLLWLSAALMGAGVWLHLTEHHEHEHQHDSLTHAHPHVHDAHHRHSHAFPWQGDEPHAHEHEHEPVTHRHAHFPDLHHRHDH